MKAKNDFIEVHSSLNGGKIICLNVRDITAIGTHEVRGKVTTILIIKGWENGTLPVTETYTEVINSIVGEDYGQ